ncbi:HdeA family protein [Roseitranquillus sediminis]|uniref:HdeA family protein n=1 Tax=Roseitranquillus sediminis TaxID=2809051 RepID=UPI001D0BFD0A|nr:HdeA family protein [Roseitranquillus sediminis]MBM9595961.1 hypothetical protein [Roseitranquillus sediminis]
MTNLSRLLTAAVLTLPLALPGHAQENAAAEEIEVAGMTCASFLELEPDVRIQVMETLAEENELDVTEIGEDRLSEMSTRCEESLQAEATQIFQEAMEIESEG